MSSSAEFFFRTEDLELDEISDLFVETAQDRAVIDQLKNRNPTILVGSRGVGKSFLLRVAQKEMMEEFENGKNFPVYLSFMRGSLLHSQDPEIFRAWMLGKISSAIIKALRKAGKLAKVPSAASVISGGTLNVAVDKTEVERFIDSAESAWKDSDTSVDSSKVPGIEDFKDALEDLKDELGIRRFVLLIDEAAHILVPQQQREFFSIFRDLRTSFVSCKAAVYPGVTSYGDSFQPAHDATVVEINRDVQDPDYLANMREIVEKQADSSLQRNIAKNSNNFDALAFASTGNPRLLLKTVHAAKKMRSSDVSAILRDFYRSDIWKDHSDLSYKYAGHADIVDWGRKFVETVVLAEVKQKNDEYLAAGKPTSAYFWISRKASSRAEHALRLLCYTGVIHVHEAGIKATRSEVGTRYRLNLGILFAKEGAPSVTRSLAIARNLTPKRMTEFGPTHESIATLDAAPLLDGDDGIFSLSEQMKKPSSELDLTIWQKAKLDELELATVGDVFQAPLERFKKAHYVGNIRARQMKNAAEAAVLEYLSG